MQANQGSHRRSLLRLRISPGFGGIILSHEVVPVWFGAENELPGEVHPTEQPDNERLQGVPAAQPEIP
jgi:hypothetical protein